MRSRHLFAAMVLTSILFAIEARATVPDAFLSVDFQPSLVTGTEAGFVAYNSPATYSTSIGNLSVSDDAQQYFNRGAPADSGSFTYGELYQDFVYTNGSGGAINFTLSGPAIFAGVQYQITWYAYDISSLSTTTVTFSPTALSNTTGSTGSVTYPAAGSGVPTTDSQYSFTGIWTATDTSLEITGQANVGSFPRINGFEIVALPEPTAGLCVLAIGSVFACRRSRQGR